jgi:CRP-like cAMP-binding protein
MQASLPCVACPNRDQGFCGALLRNPSNGLDVHEPPGWLSSRTGRRDEEVVTPDRATDDVFVLCGGLALRFFHLPNGRRQILDFLLPGDLFSVASLFARQSHFSVKALTDIQFSGFRRASVLARCAGSPDVIAAIGDVCVVETRKADELLAVLAHRSAEERVAYLLLQLVQRVRTKSVIRENRYPFPLRQHHIADAVGLTPVHVSRVMSLFRDRGIVEFSNGILQVLNAAELERLGSMR